MFGQRKTPAGPPGGLVVGPRDMVQGTVKAESVTVIGRFDGHLDATASLVVAESGSLTGSVVAARLSVEAGAVVRARCRVGLPPVEEGASPSDDPTGGMPSTTSQGAPTPAAGSRRLFGRDKGKHPR